MRKFSYLLLAGALFAGVSCATDLSEVYNRLDQLEQKVQNLERLNSTVNGLYTIVSSFENNVYVETVTETEEGYVIKFTDGKTATIKDGDKGPKGDPGDPGAPGETPAIGVADENGQLVWTVNGNVIKDESGKSVPASVSVPEFKFDNNKWWYRFGATDSWKDCGEKTGPEPSITETDEFVIINIGDKSIQIPKEVVSPAIEGLNHVFTAYTENAEGVKTYANRLFIPVGESVDLKDYFEVTPEDALKSMVEYSFTDGAPFTISDKGVLTATGAGSYTVTISAKVNPDIKTSIVIRTCETPNNQELNSTVTSEEKIVIFEGSWDEYQKMSQFGGTTAWNPFNNSMAGIFNGTLNTRIGMESATPNAKVTRDNARLHFMFYVGDASVFQPVELAAGNMLELTSSGVWDVQEIDFDLTKFVPNFKSGWNEVDLALKDATEDATFDPTKANFIRFYCNANTNGAWVAYQIKDLYVYVEEAPAQITIDGNMDEWAGVKTGLTSAKETPVYMEFKVSNDDNNIYFYSKRDKNTAIWGGGAYIYYEIDADNNSETGVDKENELGLETWLYFKPFGGSATDPAIATEFSGEQSSDEVKSNFQFKGKISDNFVEIEASLPLSVAGVTKGSTIRVFSWSNKSGDDFRGKPSEGLLYNVK